MSSFDPTAVVLAQAQAAFTEGRFSDAADWLTRLPQSTRSPHLEGPACYQASKEAMAQGRWGNAQDLLERAVAAGDLLGRERLPLVRRRKTPDLSQAAMQLLLERTLPARGLQPEALKPEIEGVYAAGAYISRGHQSQTPISKFIRYSKQPLPADEQLDMARIGGALLCHLIETRTPVLAEVDVVVSVPANPGRFSTRGWSLPDELARRLERHLAIPRAFGVLESRVEDLELRGLSWSERRKRIRNSIGVSRPDATSGRTVLIVDDVITSGATMREAAKQLTAVGTGKIYGVAVCHTEG